MIEQDWQAQRIDRHHMFVCQITFGDPSLPVSPAYANNRSEDSTTYGLVRIPPCLLGQTAIVAILETFVALRGKTLGEPSKAYAQYWRGRGDALPPRGPKEAVAANIAVPIFVSRGHQEISQKVRVFSSCLQFNADLSFLAVPPRPSRVAIRGRQGGTSTSTVPLRILD